MQNSHRAEALHAALRFVITSDTMADHKAILIETLLQALRDEESMELHRRAAEQQAHGEWQDHEIAQLKSIVQGRVAKSWQDADECVMHLAAQLKRDPRSVREKVSEIGLGASVDYRLASALRRVREANGS